MHCCSFPWESPIRHLLFAYCVLSFASYLPPCPGYSVSLSLPDPVPDMGRHRHIFRANDQELGPDSSPLCYCPQHHTMHPPHPRSSCSAKYPGVITGVGLVEASPWGVGTQDRAPSLTLGPVESFLAQKGWHLSGTSKDEREFATQTGGEHVMLRGRTQRGGVD